MLKIKDNVDLKKLEEYGFKKTIGDTYYNKKKYISDDDNEYFETYNIELIVNPLGARFYEKNKIVGCFNASSDEIDEMFDLDLLYDLIQDGLVEKVGSNE